MKKQRGPEANSKGARVVQRIELTNTDKTGVSKHNKFYQVDFCFSRLDDRYLVEATWGRIGTSGTYMVKAQGKDLNDVVDQMEKVLLQKLFKRGYEMRNIKRWPYEARDKSDAACFMDEDWD